MKPDTYVKRAEGHEILHRIAAVIRAGDRFKMTNDQACLGFRLIGNMLVGHQPGDIVKRIAAAAILPIEPSHRAGVAQCGIGGPRISFDKSLVRRQQKRVQPGGVQPRRRRRQTVADSDRR